MALSLVVESLDTLPEAVRGLYVEKDGKFALDVDGLEDTSGLKSALDKERKAAREADRARKELEAKYAGIDPEKVKALLDKVDTDEEKRLLEAGKIDDLVERRSQKRVEKMQADLEAKVNEAMNVAKAERDAAAKIKQFALSNAITNAAMGRVHESALRSGDVMRAAKELFTLTESGDVVQLDGDGEVVMSKDGKTPFSLDQWIEEQRAARPHWFPVQGSGGAANGDRGSKGGRDLSGLTPAERLTAARAKRI